jgi:hypothetical protein
MADDFALAFQNSSHLLIAAWSVDGFNHSASLKFARGCWQRYDWMGAALPDVCPHGNLDRRLSLDPHTQKDGGPERYINVYLSEAPVYLLQKISTPN